MEHNKSRAVHWSPPWKVLGIYLLILALAAVATCVYVDHRSKQIEQQYAPVEEDPPK